MSDHDQDTALPLSDAHRQADPGASVTDGPYACTLDADGARERIPQMRALRARVTGRDRRDDRLVLRFARDPDGPADPATGGAPTARAATEALVRGFVRDESECCSFFSFDVRPGAEAVTLELSAPPGAGDMLDAAAAAFDPERDEAELTAPFEGRDPDPGA